MTNMMDEKIKSIFQDESVNKIPDSYSVFKGKNIPSYIKDWLIQKFTMEDGYLDKYSLLEFIEKFIPTKSTGKTIKADLLQNRQEKKILTRALIEPDIRNDEIRFAMPDLEIKMTEGKVDRFLLDKYNELKAGEVWGVFTLKYIPPYNNTSGYILITNYTPFKPYSIDLDYYRENRNDFNLEEWVDLLIRSMEYNPIGFVTLDQKLMFISRLLIFVEPRLNIIELAPKGTGKSYIFNNLSKNGWCVSGGTVSRAKMFYDGQSKSFGFITRYDFVAFDEIQTIKFSDEDELKGALKNYLELGKFTIFNVSGNSEAGLILLGNIPLDRNMQPLRVNYFVELPSFFQESALLDRFHGFIEGWKLPRINEGMKVNGYTLNVEYFSEVLHSLRECPDFSIVVDDLLEIPKKSDTRDVTAVKRLTTAYLKLLFPNVRKPDDINKSDFENFCFKPALEKRAIIREQIAYIDSEFKREMPDITLKKFT
ncbi:MAG: BREX system Lon protease-like protein BrxL [Spirochaetota bacterium]